MNGENQKEKCLLTYLHAVKDAEIKSRNDKSIIKSQVYK